MNPERTSEPLDTETPAQQLLDRLRVLRRRWLLILTLTALVTGAALAVSLTSTKQYDATSQLLLQQQEPINTLSNPTGSSASQDPERTVNTDVALIKLDAIADRVRRTLGLPTSTRALLDEVSTAVENTSNIVSITVRDPDPARAARIANAFATQYVSFRRASARANLNQAAALARSQLASLNTADRASTQGRQLEARLRELQIASALQTGGVQVVRNAEPPAGASRPRPVLSGLLGGLLGLVFAIAAALGLEFLDRRLKDEEAVEQVYGLPLLAAIPRPPRRAGSQKPGDDHAQREAYGLLAGNLRYSSLGGDSKAIMVTSFGPAEGKTSVTLGLACALAMLGQRVIAVEADLRRPAFARYANLPPSAGLSAVLSGRRDFANELVWMDAPTLSPVTLETLSDGTSLALLPAGPPPPHPQRLLSGPNMASVIESARALADVVVVDTAPIGTVNDAVSVSNLVDATIVIARLGTTTKDAARRTLRVLRNLGAHVPGVVVTDAPAVSQGYYGMPNGDRPDPSPEGETAPIGAGRTPTRSISRSPVPEDGGSKSTRRAGRSAIRKSRSE